MKQEEYFSKRAVLNMACFDQDDVFKILVRFNPTYSDDLLKLRSSDPIIFYNSFVTVLITASNLKSFNLQDIYNFSRNVINSGYFAAFIKCHETKYDSSDLIITKYLDSITNVNMFATQMSNRLSFTQTIKTLCRSTFEIPLISRDVDNDRIVISFKRHENFCDKRVFTQTASSSLNVITKREILASTQKKFNPTKTVDFNEIDKISLPKDCLEILASEVVRTDDLLVRVAAQNNFTVNRRINTEKTYKHHGC